MQGSTIIDMISEDDCVKDLESGRSRQGFNQVGKKEVGAPRQQETGPEFRHRPLPFSSFTVSLDENQQGNKVGNSMGNHQHKKCLPPRCLYGRKQQCGGATQTIQRLTRRGAIVKLYRTSARCKKS